MACVHEWEAAPVRTGKLLSPCVGRRETLTVEKLAH